MAEEIDYSKCSNGCAAHSKLQEIISRNDTYAAIEIDIIELIEACPVYQELNSHGVKDDFAILRWDRQEREVRCHFYGFSESCLLDFINNPNNYKRLNQRAS